MTLRWASGQVAVRVLGPKFVTDFDRDPRHFFRFDIMTSSRTTSVLRHLRRVNKTPLQSVQVPLTPIYRSPVQCTSCTRTYISIHNSSRPYLSRPTPIVPQRFSRRTVFIQTSPTPNDNALKFIPTEHSILPPSSP